MQARLRVHAHAEVVDPLRRRRRGRHAQRVEVVRHRRLVAVLGEEADGEVHSGGGEAGGGRRGRASKVPLGDVDIDLRELALNGAERAGERPVALRRARPQVEVGHQAADAQHGRRAAVAGVGGGQRVVQRLDRERDRVGVVALVQQEARDRPRVRGSGDRAPVGLEAADRLQQRERLAVADVLLLVVAVRRERRRAASAAPCRPPRSRRPPAGTRAPRRAASCGWSRPRTSRSARARTRRRSTGRSAAPPTCRAAAARGGTC